MRTSRLLITAAVIAASVLATVGCGSSAPTVHFVGAGNTTGAVPSRSVPAPTSAPPAAGATPAVSPSVAATRTGSTGRCGHSLSLSPAWASWPMPNPHGLGLPNQTSYTDLRNGSVKDNVTCLIWQAAYSSQKLTWAAATSYCASLNIGGTGWRLPSRVELTSIIDFTRSGPAIDIHVFNGVANFFWTRSPWAVAHTPQYVWVTNFYEGLTSNAGNTAGTYFARCVKAGVGTGAATYQSVATGAVEDTHTGLIWQRASSPTSMSAEAATRYCSGLSLDGARWRLPSINELATTVDESMVAPAINRSTFPDTAKTAYYWSSSKSDPKPSATWGLSYEDGFTSFYNVTTGYARCVR